MFDLCLIKERERERRERENLEGDEERCQPKIRGPFFFAARRDPSLADDCPFPSKARLSSLSTPSFHTFLAAMA